MASKSRDPKKNYRIPTPGRRDQVSVRLGEELVEKAEERALEESLNERINISFAELMRRAVTHYLENVPLPPKAPSKPPCGFSDVAGGKLLYCVTCNQHVGKRRTTIYCKNLDRRVKIER